VEKVEAIPGTSIKATAFNLTRDDFVRVMECVGRDRAEAAIRRMERWAAKKGWTLKFTPLREPHTLISCCPVHSYSVGSYPVNSSTSSERTLRPFCTCGDELLSRSRCSCSVPPSRTPCLSLSYSGEGEL